jgi:hypothetical protein
MRKAILSVAALPHAKIIDGVTSIDLKDLRPVEGR